MSLSKKLLALVTIPVIVCIGLAIAISSINIQNQGVYDLKDKSNAILTLSILEYIESHQYGSSLFDVDKSEKLAGITSIADSSAEHYEFRIASMNPKNKEHIADETEIPFLKQFEDGGVDELTHIDEKSNTLWVMRPVFMDKEQGCMRCHKLGENDSNEGESKLRGIFIVKSEMEHVKEQVKESIIENSILGLIIAIIAIVIGVVVMRKVIGAIKQVVEVSRQVSEGNLQVQVKIETNDELSALGNFINTMVGSLNNLLTQVDVASNNLIQGTNEISGISGAISQGNRNQVSQFDNLSNSVQNTTQNLVAANKLANQSASQAEMAENEMDRITATISDIEKSSQNIDQEVKIIEEIARNINILALNAAVEAARAGEHGKGFAVVAAEVRKLSQLTSQSSVKITEVATNSLSQVESGVEVIEEAGKKIKQVIEFVNEIATILNEISLATQEQSQIMDNNLETIHSNSSSANELKQSAAKLNERANKLIEMVELFKLSNK